MLLVIGFIAGLALAWQVHWYLAYRAYRRRLALSERTVPWWTTPTVQRGRR